MPWAVSIQAGAATSFQGTFQRDYGTRKRTSSHLSQCRAVDDKRWETKAPEWSGLDKQNERAVYHRAKQRLTRPRWPQKGPEGIQGLLFLVGEGPS